MSDSARTPQGTARVNSERFDTELAAVWYASNYYYQTSFRRAREYIGVVFKERQQSKPFGITVRGDGSFEQSKVRIGDVPSGTIPVAVWHTHLPAEALHTAEEQLVALLLSGFDVELADFSPRDIDLADRARVATLQRYGSGFSIYLATDRIIKRYRPGLNQSIQTWVKDRPSGMRRGR